MPDETLQSRITRYHFLSGNKTEADTFRDLFGSAPFSFTMLPKQLEGLAERLPGEQGFNLRELLTANTLFPAYQPFLGVSKEPIKGREERLTLDVARIPRREGAIHTRAKICISCSQEDLVEYGCSYWHRAHHLPGVTACWRHGEQLIHSCPSCSLPFYRKYKLLPNLAGGCVCGWCPLRAIPRALVLKEEKQFAEFANGILQSNFPPVEWEALSECYRRQALRRGFNHGGLIGIAKLIDSIQLRYGDELISRIDRAYASGKRFQWLRFTTARGQIDMPLARHLLVSHHLFGSAERFGKCLAQASLLHSAAKASPPPKAKPSTTDKKQQFRDKVNTFIETRPDVCIEYLWMHAYQATLWLMENDKAWLLARLSVDKKLEGSEKIESDPRDGKYAALIQDGVGSIYQVTQRPKRVNISNILSLLPMPLRMTTAKRQERYPLVSQQLELHLESLWHFRLRRSVWVVAEMSRLKLPPTITNLRLLSSIPSPAWQAIVNFFEWDLDKLLEEHVDAEALLRAAGVSRQWEGPSGYDAPMGGNAYLEMVAQTTRP